MTKSIECKLALIIIDKHEKDCQCTYCTDRPTNSRKKYGLNIPQDWKAPNSWWVIKLWPGVYFRWTNTWLRKIQPRK